MRTIIFNYPLLVSLIATALAQLVKVPMHFLTKGRWDWRQLLTSGGMPSSHAATVSCLATSLGTTQGFASPLFGIAAILGLIVMYDAAGIRRHAGETAMALNRLEADFDTYIEEENRGKSRFDYKLRHKRLKEKLGHQPAEVVAGALFGIAVALVFQWAWL